MIKGYMVFALVANRVTFTCRSIAPNVQFKLENDKFTKNAGRQ